MIRYKCNQEWNIPFSERKLISRRTILNWIQRYEKSGKNFESLYPNERNDKNVSRSINLETVNNINYLIKNNEIRSAKNLIIEINKIQLNNHKKILPRSTVYRFLHQNN